MSEVVYVDDIKLAAALFCVGMSPREPVETNFIERVSQSGAPPRDWFYFKNNGVIRHYLKAWKAREDYYESEDGTFRLDVNHRFWIARLALRNREHILDKIKNTRRILFIIERGNKIGIFTRNEP